LSMIALRKLELVMMAPFTIPSSLWSPVANHSALDAWKWLCYPLGSNFRG
jgi:hypothetical protein